jgi:hypothetical protein
LPGLLGGSSAYFGWCSMIVPQYWAEARRRSRKGAKQVTVRRFGWSDVSDADAQAMADSRADDALAQAMSGVSLIRREPKVAYNGAQGVPIREEVVARFHDAVVTRNAYGARCLNSPDVVFADVDFQVSGALRLKFAVFAVLAALSAVAGWYFGSGVLGAGLVLASMFAAGLLGNALHGMQLRAAGGGEGLARQRVVSFLASNPTWNIRLYRTPAGLRLLATHSPLLPTDPSVLEFFNAIGVDPIYARMCLNQNCFRARLTAKPWRIGVQSHMRPRPGVWPVRPDKMALRAAWVADYESKAAAYAACQFVESMGSGKVDLNVARIVEFHDDACRAMMPNMAIA